MTFDPKIELHLHLEGAAPPEFVGRLADEKKMRLDGVFNEAGSYDYKDFEGFLQVYERATEVLKTPEDYARLTRAVLEHSVEQGVIYTEAFLSPDFCGGRDLTAWREYMHAMQEAAGAVPGIEMRGIVTCIRHFGPDKARETARCAAETAGDFITGFGIGGNEGLFAPGDFVWAYDCAREAGLGLTAHAGEFGGPESVRSALDDLGVSRIGHGVRAVEDEALIDRLAEDGIVLEVCPGSNVALGVYANIAAHPIEKLRERGVKVTVSTDDPPFFHTTMREEYEALERTFGWDGEAFRQINRTAAEAAFCDDATRADLLARLEA
ncbi:adenosine deaminase [Jannaschia rubra]|uniref:Adenine deaminase n=1 Tax=Jannaschia rubra TaxID=282197 RepID=A0A0M6XMN0_9RHOB|nr:adenosine deaminase [Jannaschia rubra]CTQ31827.1 Adenine deaminase [Jannaschia rubra]SFG52902.1 adenosine deaminase [Jannaschia rubra]